MEAAIRFSQNSLPSSGNQHFLKIDVAGRQLQLYNIPSQKRRKVEYELVHASSKLPQAFRAFDWHPVESHLVAIGQTSGEASLVDLSAGQEGSVTFPVRSQRTCNAVGTNTKNWLAVGLEKVRNNDFCLNIWDLNQRITSASSTRLSSKTSSEPLHKLAGGESITSLRFFQDQPQLLAAGVKGQFIRLYDLREPNSTFSLQFTTRCVNNIAVDTQDENYLASCLPSNQPTVAVWDRRMVTRTNVPQYGFGMYVGQASQRPEPSVELSEVVDVKSQIWGLRFSKTHRGHFGVLSSTGHLRMLKLGFDHSFGSEEHQDSTGDWQKQQPSGVYVQDSQNFASATTESLDAEALKRIVSFDFTTATTTSNHSKIITLSGHGDISIEYVRSTRPTYRSHTLLGGGPIQAAFAPTFEDTVTDDTSSPVSKSMLVRKLCQEGYMIDADKNLRVVGSNEPLRSAWSWLRQAQKHSTGGSMVQGDIDFSFLGIFALWMEEVDVKHRCSKTFASTGNINVPPILRDLAKSLGLTRGKGCQTEYGANRALCLHVCGVPFMHEDVIQECDQLVSGNNYTEAAAVALFAGEEKVAQKVLSSEGTTGRHKMLAMALLGARGRHTHPGSSSHRDGQSIGTVDQDWQDLVSSVAEDLRDCYARAILAYVKTGDWEDVLKLPCLPLRHRVYIALRHLDDSKLTHFISTVKNEVITSGNLEGLIITGLGTAESIELLKHYVRLTGDLQSSTLIMSFAAASDQYLPPESPHTRTVQCFRSTYKSQLMSLGLKIAKARFDVALANAIRETGSMTLPTRKEQLQLVCSHCSQSLTQFGPERHTADVGNENHNSSKHSLASEKAAVAGVVCPKCGKHLPRCGVCDMWLGTPDETWSKWYKPPSRSSNTIDLSTSMAGSQVTAIGPNASSTPSIFITDATTKRDGRNGVAKKITTADVPAQPIEVVDEYAKKLDRERQWYEAMHKFTVFCMRCSHGFHAEHAKMWFDGQYGQPGHSVCPVPMCECLCNS